MILKPNALDINLDMSQFAPGANDPKQKYGLPAKIAFCINCGVSNQRPNSTVEFHHTGVSKKKPSPLAMTGFVTPVGQHIARTKSTGKSESVSWLNCATASAAAMVRMTAWYLARAARTAFTSPGF